jgi:hypothetical protein
MDLLAKLREDEAVVRSIDQLKEDSPERWHALPAAIKDIFANTPKAAMYEALRRMDVEAQPARSVEWSYNTRRGSLAVTVWHDQIRVDLSPDLLYYVPTKAWGLHPGLTRRAEAMRKDLERFSGQTVGVLLLQHDWDKNDTQIAKRAAPDIKKWLVEKVADGEFILWRGRRVNVK